MKKLKVAIDVYGRISLLEKFPDDEKHAGLNAWLDDIHGDFEVDGKYQPGVYLADFSIELNSGSYLGEYTAEPELVIDDLKFLYGVE